MRLDILVSLGMKDLLRTQGGLIRPAALRRGQTIGLVAPASPCWTENGIARSAQYLERLGYRVAVAPHCADAVGYLAGADRDRASDLNSFFADPDIDAIFCIRGGYGALRLVEFLDWGLIAANPKIFAGYSDITTLHAAIGSRCGFVTFHAPMPVSDMIDGFSDFSASSFFAALSGAPIPSGNPEGFGMSAVCPGVATGALCGGNLSLVAASLGTPWEIDAKGKILFLEDIGEEPYSVDRMLTQLRLAGKIDECAGVLLGEWTDCESKGSYRESATVAEILRAEFSSLGKPAIAGVRAGHCDPTLTLPFGVLVSLEADEAGIASWRFEESPVTESGS